MVMLVCFVLLGDSQYIGVHNILSIRDVAGGSEIHLVGDTQGNHTVTDKRKVYDVVGAIYKECGLPFPSKGPEDECGRHSSSNIRK